MTSGNIYIQTQVSLHYMYTDDSTITFKALILTNCIFTRKLIYSTNHSVAKLYTKYITVSHKMEKDLNERISYKMLNPDIGVLKIILG